MAKQKQPPKPCKMCNDKPANSGEKYCTGCRKVVLSEMADSGYLTQPKDGAPISEQRGRKINRPYAVGGGSAEMGTDGDD